MPQIRLLIFCSMPDATPAKALGQVLMAANNLRGLLTNLMKSHSILIKCKLTEEKADLIQLISPQGLCIMVDRAVYLGWMTNSLLNKLLIKVLIILHLIQKFCKSTIRKRVGGMIILVSQQDLRSLLYFLDQHYQ